MERQVGEQSQKVVIKQMAHPQETPLKRSKISTPLYKMCAQRTILHCYCCTKLEIYKYIRLFLILRYIYDL